MTNIIGERSGINTFQSGDLIILLPCNSPVNHSTETESGNCLKGLQNSPAIQVLVILNKTI